MSSADALTEEMREIWCEVFARRDISETSDFFAVGGNSLMAIRLVAKVRARTELRVPLRLVFSHSTLGEFTEAVRQQTSDHS